MDNADKEGRNDDNSDVEFGLDEMLHPVQAMDTGFSRSVYGTILTKPTR
jgi:hypothetical protein